MTVFERPGLQEFLDQINKFADLVLFTAGLEGSMLLHFFLLNNFSSVFFLVKLYLGTLQVMLDHSLTN